MTGETDPIDDILAGSVGRDLDVESEVPDSRRPSLIRLSLDVESLIAELMDGFESRRAILDWMRRLITRSLGEVSTEFFGQMGDEFRSADPNSTVVAAMLTSSARDRNLDPDAGRRLRRRIASEVVDPGYRRAFRALASGANEYIDDGDRMDPGERDPAKQRYIAMRPAISEIDDHQKRCVDAILDGRLDDPDDIRRWGSIAEIASHGSIRSDLVRRSIVEGSMRRILTASDPVPSIRRARELYVARFLLPAFNAGVRDLRNRANEQPETVESSKSTPSL